MASIKERQAKIPVKTRYSAVLVACVVAAASVFGSLLTSSSSDADIWRYIVYAGAGVALLISLVVYYHQNKP